MANVATNTDTLLAAVLSQMVHETLADRADLRPLVKYFGSISGSGSNLMQVPTVSMNDAMAASSEGATPSETGLTDSKVTITVARKVLVRKITDLYDTARSIAPSYEAFAEDMTRAYVLSFGDVLCSLFTGLTAVKGSATLPLTVDDIYDAAATLRSANIGNERIHCVLHPIQYSHFIESLRGEGQSVVDPMSSEMLKLKGFGYQGQWNGIDFWVTDSVSTETGAHGAMFVDGCFGFADGIPAIVRNQVEWARIAPKESPVFVEFDRDAVSGLSIVVGNAYFGISMIEDARGVEILSTATL